MYSDKIVNYIENKTNCFGEIGHKQLTISQTLMTFALATN